MNKARWNLLPKSKNASTRASPKHLSTHSSSRKCKMTQLQKADIPEGEYFRRTILTAFSELKRLSFSKQETSLFLFRNIMSKISIKTPFIILELLVRDKQIVFCGRWWHWRHRGHHLLASLKAQSFNQVTQRAFEMMGPSVKIWELF